jgi:hypothetical protein
VEAIREGQLPTVQILNEVGVPLNNPNQLMDIVLNAMAYG